MSDEVTSWLDEAEQEHTDEGARNDANRKDTLPANRYRCTITKIKVSKADWEKCPYPGRRMLNLSLALQVPYTDEDGNEQFRKNTQFLKVSPDPYKMVESPDEINEKTGKPKWIRVPKGHELYTPAARMDAEFKNWVALEQLVSSKDNKLTIPEVLERLDGYEFSVYVSEQFKDEEGNYHKPESEEQRQAFLEEGWSSYNDISGIRK